MQKNNPTPATVTETQGRVNPRDVEQSVLRLFVKLAESLDDYCMGGTNQKFTLQDIRHLANDAANQAHTLLRMFPNPKDSPCSDVSQGSTVGSTGTTPSFMEPRAGSSSSPVPTSLGSGPNPPAWATPQILAACGPGERLRYDRAQKLAWSDERKLWWDPFGNHGVIPHGFLLKSDEFYHMPTPPARCDGSGKRFDYERPDADSQGRVTCPGCPACKPEHKDGAEEVADSILDNIYNNGTKSYEFLRQRVSAAIRADRAAQPAPSPALGEKVRELAEYVKLIVPGDSQKGRLARQVLALLEGKN